MELDVFENIDAAWDYILELESSKLVDGSWGQPPAILNMGDDAFSHPITNEEAQSLVIPYDNLDYPETGYFNTADDDKFILSRLFSGRFSLKPNLRHRKFLFRGQDQDHGSCTPNLHRTDNAKHPLNQDRFIEEMMRGQEMMLLMLRHPLVQLLDSGILLAGRLVQFEMNLFGITQHYYNKTSFIDLTSNTNVASFFATCGYDSSTDQYYPKNDGIGIIYFYELDGLNDFKAKNPRIEPRLNTIGQQIFPRSGRQYGFLCNIGEKEDFAKLPQVKSVKFKQDVEYSNKYFEMFEGGNTLFPDDILSRHWKERNLEQKRISRKAVEMNLKFNPHRTFTYLLDKIKQKGYQVVDYKPRFTLQELKEYCDDMANGGWEQWCRQLHIPGDKDGKMMTDLLNAPSNPAYRWAFDLSYSRPDNFEPGRLLKYYQKLLK